MPETTAEQLLQESVKLVAILKRYTPAERVVIFRAAESAINVLTTPADEDESY